MDPIQILVQHIRQFIPLEDPDAEKIKNHFIPLSKKKKTFLLKERQVCHARYFVAKGCLRMFFLKENGTEQITQFAIENWWIADFMSLSRQQPSHFFIQAIEDSEIIQLRVSSEVPLFQAVPSMERYFRQVTERAYAASQFRIKFLYDFSREELFRHFMESYPEFAQRIPQYMLASYLGFTPEYLSEIRKRSIS
ncbi:Crp/Fnr family transcriptional regulator [Negadavirga shengliensis]|uniref:Crp/Fnr family transcriptional regulator n=1 Tax=Negadavirga shengliensis TaxID=1389218 RepID=A0ABV9T4M6_9BACT